MTFIITSILVVLIECPLSNLTRLYTNPSKVKADNEHDIDSDSGDEERRRGVWGLILRDSLPSTANLDKLDKQTERHRQGKKETAGEASSLLSHI